MLRSPLGWASGGRVRDVVLSQLSPNRELLCRGTCPACGPRHPPAIAGSRFPIASGIAAANRIARYPYRYGGGHRSFHDSGYDCSGSVSYVLHAMGVLSSPLDSSQLMSYGAPGPGRWVTIYSNPGHAYMTIRGRRFDTSAQWQGGSRWSIFDRSSAGYTVRHPPGL